MQDGSIVRLGTGCPKTRDGKHHVEDHCRQCGGPVGLAELVGKPIDHRVLDSIARMLNEHVQCAHREGPAVLVYDARFEKWYRIEVRESEGPTAGGE